jgi:acyl-CoA reductase-like NAD-dependent aldehyde dehydrogenase
VSDRERFLNHINGRFVEPQSGLYLPVWEPATGQQYAEVAASNRADVDAACEAALRASRACELGKPYPPSGAAKSSTP